MYKDNSPYTFEILDLEAKLWTPAHIRAHTKMPILDGKGPFHMKGSHSREVYNTRTVNLKEIGSSDDISLTYRDTCIHLFHGKWEMIMLIAS